MSQQCHQERAMAEHSHWSNLAKLGRALVTVAISLYSGTLSTRAAVMASANPRFHLDWSEWDTSDAETLEGPNYFSIDASTNRGEDGKGCRRREGKTLHQFVGDCARLFHLPGVACDRPIDRDGYRMPFMDAANSSCGFQTRMEQGTLEDTAARYVFHFVGDSTTRRLAESFVSILTGQASTHPVVHERIDMSSGSLKVIFHWAPLCGDVGSAIQASINEIVVDQQRGGCTQAIIITAFGVHNAYNP